MEDDQESDKKDYSKRRRDRRSTSRRGRDKRSVRVKFPSLESPLVPYKAFVDMQRDNLSSEEAQKFYDQYKADHNKKQADLFYDTHKNESWFKEKYDPE